MLKEGHGQRERVSYLTRLIVTLNHISGNLYIWTVVEPYKNIVYTFTLFHIFYICSTHTSSYRRVRSHRTEVQTNTQS